ncbi:HTH domain-containing protein [Candidatus Enterococcus murrayae]|uniref:Transposase n=1 Tax=Candidatus Enterococcus murrayae TaxID=2815321 RepID=A0ABS3HLZ9_9ENTE|nr:HTH domain-containing protein [Enterococcus sp. MJM16]MBO0454471.1 hypothetical protein [Enterococcus sp. MJM16]
MREYTKKQIKELESNEYTLKVTSKKMYFTAKFKKDFWISYQAGNAPRKIISDFGYDVSMFPQKRIDSLVQRIKHQAMSGEGFKEGEDHSKRVAIKKIQLQEDLSPQSLKQIQRELLYLRQEVEFLKKITKINNSK